MASYGGCFAERRGLFFVAENIENLNNSHNTKNHEFLTINDK